MLKKGFRRLIAAAVGCGLVAVPAIASALPAGAAPAVSAPVFGSAVAVAPPLGSAADQRTYLNTVSCAGNRACVAGGSFSDSAGVSHGMVVTQSGAKWTGQAKIPLPANASAQYPASEVVSLTCQKAGHCVAVGDYFTAGAVLPLVVTQANGKWGGALSPALPAGASARPQQAMLTAVGCTAAGYCQAVGTYRDARGHIQPMTVARATSGRWGRGIRLPVPPGAVTSPGPRVSGVACTAPSTCAAAGWYYTAATAGATAPLGLVETKGKWTAVRIAIPAGASDADLRAISCGGPGSCLAVGDLVAAGLPTGFGVPFRSGRFGRAALISATAPGVASPARGELFAVSCLPAGSCVATGEAYATSGQWAAVAITGNGGNWRAALVIPPPVAAPGVLLESLLTAVSCTGTLHCTAVGYYTVKNGATVTYQAAATSTG